MRKVAPAVRVLATLAFGCAGTICSGVLDIALAGQLPPALTVQDIVGSVAAVTLSHHAGSALAHRRRNRAELAMASAPAEKLASSLTYIEPAPIKSTADAVKAL
jgi:hypothetical protein